MSSFSSIPTVVQGTESDLGGKIKNHDKDEYGDDNDHPKDHDNCVTEGQGHDATRTSNDKPIFRKRSLSLPNTCGGSSEGELLLQQQQQPSNDHYMSEPSLSEDGTGASSSNYTPLSPINRAIHMTHSHSNTSLSSLGSPSYANAKSSSSRKKIYFFGDHYKTSLGDSSNHNNNNSNSSNSHSNSNSITAAAAKKKTKKEKKIQKKMNASPLLSPIEAYSESDSTHVGEGSEMNITMPIPDNCKLSTDDFQKGGEDENNVQHSILTSEEHNMMEFTPTHENGVREQTNDNEQIAFLDNDTKIPFFQLLGDGTTSDSHRYMAAMEGSNGSHDGDVVDDDDGNDDGDDDGSSDLSYDSSSSQENDGKGNGNDNGKGGDQSNFHKDASLPLSNDIQTGNDSCHYLNKPSTVETPKSSGNARSKKLKEEEILLEDEEILLKNTDSGSMDLSLIVETKSPYSPDDSLLAETPSSNFMISTPPRITPFDFPEAAEESITPKMKTSRPSSISGSPSSHSDGGRKSILTKSASLPTSLETCEKDEKMGRQNRVNSGEKRHRRTRSGDETAAMISTGSSEWVGMEFHKIPLPSERDVDDDDDEVVEYHDEGINDTTENFGKQRRRARSFQVEVGTGFNQNISAKDGTDKKLQQKERSTSGDGISSRFSPRIAADLNFEEADHFVGSTLHRSQSFGEASVSTADSSFSWISRGTSFLLKESDYPKNSNSSDPLLVHEGDFSTWGRANYNSLSSIAQSADNNFIPMGTQDLSAHVIPDFDRDLEMQDEQTRSKRKFSVFSKTKSASNSSNFSVEPSKSQGDLEQNYPTFRCPKCNTLQREFLTVSSARTRFESPSQYIAIYFFIYMLMSLFIFGMEEGWPALDCVYFSVITLTTTGLGDYVPDNDAAKIICSIFIYFGVSCIGLLLGSMHASSLDDAAKKQAKENRTSNCVVCGRKQGHLATHALTYGLGKQPSMQNSMQNFKKTNNMKSTTSVNETTSLLSLERTTYPPSSSSWYNPRGSLSKLNTIEETQHHANLGWKAGISTDTSSSQGSAGPAENTARQSNTRQNFAESPAAMTNIFDPAYKSSNRRRVESDATVNTSNQNYAKTQPSTSANFHLFDDNISDIDNADNNSQCSGWSTFSHPAEADNDILRPVSKIKAAKYVFLTLKQAFTNSLFVILIGSVGFYFIEEHMTVVDAFYFTTVLLTTVGYGDIVPKSPEGKLFCTVYSLIAGAVLLHQMSMISMIPLELRKRRIERSVLLQFGEDLDDTALEELTTGPLMRRLQLSGNNPEGLGQCTRETFALAMLVRLGRITEQDIRSTYAAFNKLDKNNDGFLTNSSKAMATSTFDRKRRAPKSAMQDLGVFLPNQQLNTFRQQLPQDDVASESGRERGMSIESNYSAITYEDVDDANPRWSKNMP